MFHSQQAAEKAAKAFLTSRNTSFRKTHDLVELGRQCTALDSELAALFQTAADLNDYAVVFRYVDAPHEPDETEATLALEIAQRVFEAIALRLVV